MRLLQASERKASPWKNGGGVTTEIAIHPAGAALDAFDWRISLATVAVDGPFSIFPGIERTLTVLSGAGIDLAVEGLADVRLDSASLPYFFPGDAMAGARLVDGPIDDLNVMTRRGRVRHQVERLGLAAGTRQSVRLPSGVVFATGRCRIGDLSLEPRDALRIDEALSFSVEADSALDLFLIALA
jgi:environmental stress-induced protein Ves